MEREGERGSKQEREKREEREEREERAQNQKGLQPHHLGLQHNSEAGQLGSALPVLCGICLLLSDSPINTTAIPTVLLHCSFIFLLTLFALSCLSRYVYFLKLSSTSPKLRGPPETPTFWSNML